MVHENMDFLQSWGFRLSLHNDPSRLFVHQAPVICEVPMRRDLAALLDFLPGAANPALWSSTSTSNTHTISSSSSNNNTNNNIRTVLPNPVRRVLCSKACRSAVMFGDQVSAEKALSILS